MNASDYISLGAVVLSLFALCVSLYEAVSNKPRLRLSASGNVRIVQPGWPQNPVLGVSVVNRGRQPTTITVVMFAVLKFIRIPGRYRYTRRYMTLPLQHSTRMPHVLDVGRSADFFFDLDAADPKGGCLKDDLKKRRFRVLVKHSWSERYAEVKVGK